MGSRLWDDSLRSEDIQMPGFGSIHYAAGIVVALFLPVIAAAAEPIADPA